MRPMRNVGAAQLAEREEFWSGFGTALVCENGEGSLTAPSSRAASQACGRNGSHVARAGHDRRYTTRRILLLCCPFTFPGKLQMARFCMSSAHLARSVVQPSGPTP